MKKLLLVALFGMSCTHSTAPSTTPEPAAEDDTTGTSDPCYADCMEYGPDPGSPFDKDFDQLSKEERENACSGYCADIQKP
jgi:hypothetical protein